MTYLTDLKVGDYFTLSNLNKAAELLGRYFLHDINETSILRIIKQITIQGTDYYMIEKNATVTEEKAIKITTFKELIGTVVDMKNNPKAIRDALRSRLSNSGTGLFTVGTDPEMFVVKNKKVIPAFDFLGKKPKTITQHPKAYWDGFQAEYNTQPSGCLAWQIDHIHQGMLNLHQEAKRVGGQLTIKSVVNVPLTTLAKLPKDKVEFGCTPSINAYGEAVPIPDGKDVNFRMAGGHLHLGGTSIMRTGRKGADLEKMDLKINNTIKALDRTLGVMSVALFYGLEDKRRRELYGRAGEFRTPKHGIEYRVLSNAWLVHPVTANLVFEIARVVAASVVYNPENKMYDFLTEMDTTDEEVQDIINNLDIRKARSYIKRHEGLFKALLTKVTYYENSVDHWYSLVLRGVSTRLRKDHSLEKAWCLNGGWVNHNESEGRNIRKFSDMIRSSKTPDTLLLTG